MENKKHQALVKAKHKEREDDQCTLAAVDDFVVVVLVIFVELSAKTARASLHKNNE